MMRSPPAKELLFAAALMVDLAKKRLRQSQLALIS
jgi:hypothetical protein